MTDVKISLTQRQYCAIVSLMQSLPRILTLDSIPGAAEETPSPTSIPATSLDPDPSIYPTNLAPELHPRTPVDSGSTSQRVTLDLVFSVKSVRLQLYNSEAIREADFKETGISRFDLNDNTVRVKMQSDGAVEAEVALQSFTMTNTLPGPSRFREIIPAHKNRDVAQFMVLYTSSGVGGSLSSVIIVTIDSPKILFALDPMFALLAFLTSAFPSPSTPENGETMPGITGSVERQTPPTDAVTAFRLDLHDVSITVLESDQQANSQAIQLSIKRVLMSQQVCLVLQTPMLSICMPLILTILACRGFWP
jgi:vacuolar protein sorting-associated protein 13A/C